MSGEVVETNAAIRIESEPQVSGVITHGSSFYAVSQLIDLSAPIRRPKKCRPALGDKELQQELEAWDAASDEAFRVVDDTLPE